MNVDRPKVPKLEWFQEPFLASFSDNEKASKRPMNLIYIVEPEQMLVPEDIPEDILDNSTYTPNFTIPGQEKHGFDAPSAITIEKIQPMANKATIAASVATMVVSPPIGLLVAAVSASPVIGQLIGKAADALSEDLKATKERELAEFLRKHAITIAMAERRGYRFPPGHPLVGQSYKLHPLSKLPGSGKAGVYVPQESYDETLLEEREAELLRLLVELGATKISIHEKHTQQASTSSSGSVGAQSKVLGEAKIEGGLSSTSGQLNLDAREFELVGKPWPPGARLDRSIFAWLAFEPSWGALISAREIGECTKAAIEIKEETSFSSEKRLSLEVKSKLYGGSASGSHSSDRQSGRVYMVKAEFAPFQSPKSTTVEIQDEAVV